jgi:hypothetical protein
MKQWTVQGYKISKKEACAKILDFGTCGLHGCPPEAKNRATISASV